MDTAVLAVRTILSLTVVLGLIWYAGRRLNDSTSGRDARGDGMLAGWVRKAGGVVGRAPARGGRRAARAPVVSVVGRQAIGPKASVAVVDVGGQRLVLGVSEAGVTLLTTMDTPIEEVVIEEVAVAAVTTPAVTTPPVDLPTFDEALAAATAAPKTANPRAAAPQTVDPRTAAPQTADPQTAAPRTGRVAGSVLSPATWRQARAALRPGPTP